MVRRGSTVRVRQWALQNPRSRGFFVQDDLRIELRAVGMEPFIELCRRDEARFVACEDNLAVARVDLLCAKGGGRVVRRPEKRRRGFPQRRMGRVAGSASPRAAAGAPASSWYRSGSARC